jgi:hypothetical protein
MKMGPAAEARYIDEVGARLLDFCGDGTPWYRRLWSVGTLVALEEVVEASQAVRDSVLTSGAFRTIRDAVKRVVGRDPALAGPTKELVQKCLTGDLTAQGLDYRTVRHVLSELHEDYLGRWADVALDKSRWPDAETTATSLVAHALDSGVSASYLRRWWVDRILNAEGDVSLREVISGIADLLTTDGSTFEILIPIEGPVTTRISAQSGWRDQTGVGEWLEANNASPSRQYEGGFVSLERANDPEAAVDRAAEALDRLDGLLTLAGEGGVAPVGYAWIAGDPEEYPLIQPRRVELSCLIEGSPLYEQRAAAVAISALELLAVLGRGHPAAAVAAGWATVEALLVGPGDGGERVVAADRLATIVVCSLPHAELDDLGRTHEYLSPESVLSDKLRSTKKSIERAKLVADAILDGVELTLADPSDEAAARRMEIFLRNPKLAAESLRRQTTAALRRLYRQRNLVLHWGRLQPVALRSTVRTAAPLLGAGVDSIVEAWLSAEIDPLGLAARARIALHSLNESSGSDSVRLLYDDR